MVPLVATKLHVPRRRRGQVPRPRLVRHLAQGDEAALTLVSAPAGFGKTTAVTELLAGRPSVAWLSLDERDDDPAVFWRYVLAAVQTVAPEIGAGAPPPSEPGALDTLLGTLLNDLAARPAELVLVLDDYHLVTSAAVHEQLVFLVEHLPPQVHLVLATRADPALPLARWRSRGELVEVRAADLRFTVEEAVAYLTEGMGLALSAAQVETLQGRTEGWIAALQLAALSLRGREDVADYLADFAGDDRFIVDYLVDEVLSRQPAELREFLLRTSVLPRLSPELCDAVTGRTDGRTMLEALERGNLFLVPLDGRRRWSRYHHLFADVLQVHLRAEHPAAVPELHRRAADWFERAGDRQEAVTHALAGGDVERAADLIGASLLDLQRDRREATMRRWLEALPADVLRARPALAVGYAGALMVNGEPRGVEDLLRSAEQGPSDTDGLRGPIALYRAALALVDGDPARARTQAGRALELAADPVSRGSAAGILGLVAWGAGDLDEGYRRYAEAAEALESAGHRSDAAGCTLGLADIRLAQGRLGEAQAVLERALRLVTPVGGALRGAADLHVGLGTVLLERGDLTGARRHLATAEELGDRLGLPQHPYRRRVIAARLREAAGDPAEAVRLLDDAARHYVGDYFPEVAPVPALRARVRARHGGAAEALAWAAERGLATSDEPTYLREVELLVLARALVARGERLDDAVGLLDRLGAAAEAGGRTGSLLAVLVTRALAEQARGDEAAALDAVRRALAAADGHVRVFLDEGPLLVTLLDAAGGDRARAVLAHAEAPSPTALVAPLSARELDVLRLLGTDLDGPDIARRLFLSVNTVRTHTRNLYAKLGVTSRRAAVRRGAELDLLPPR